MFSVKQKVLDAFLTHFGHPLLSSSIEGKTCKRELSIIAHTKMQQTADETSAVINEVEM